MKCPKCGYLGFEAADRCRNCGYEFSLATPVGAPAPDLSLRTDEWRAVPDDLDLKDPTAGRTGRASKSSTPDHNIAAPTAPVQPTPAELPLFGPPLADDEPLIKRPSAPRAPLAVRRATPEVPRLRPDPPRIPTLDLGEPAAPDGPDAGRQSHNRHAVTAAQTHGSGEDASVAARFAAVLVDAVVLAAIDVLVVYFTMQICGVSPDELWLLPKGPLLAFLLVQNGGYLLAFTAGGQTLGKMIAGIRVVSDDASPLDMGRAAVRTVFWVLLAVPAGLGFLSAALSSDHRGLHDRMSRTRVVRA